MLFSSHETTGEGANLSYTNEKLIAQFASHIKNIDFWFWGHEHAWTRYAAYRGLSRGYLLGNGGIPVTPKDKAYVIKPVNGQVPPDTLSKNPSMFSIEGIQLYCNGLYSLQFDGSNLSVRYMELHQSGASWVLEDVPGESQKYAIINGIVQ